jgi:hypothetical protein
MRFADGPAKWVRRRASGSSQAQLNERKSQGGNND